MVDMTKLNLEEDIRYKLSCGVEITIQHVKVKDWYMLESCLNLLKIYKNEINDPNVIMMSYLDYIKNICDDESTNMMFSLLITYTIKESMGNYGGWTKSKNKNVYAITDQDKNVLFYINNKDFEDIKKIILHQNFYNYDDTYINPEIRKAIEKQRKLEMKGYSSPTLEKQKIFVMGKTGFTKDALNNMTYREFSQLYKQKVDEDIYFARNIIKSGYSCTIEGTIIHPLFQKEKGALEEILIDADSFKNKVQQVNNN